MMDDFHDVTKRKKERLLRSVRGTNVTFESIQDKEEFI